MTTWSGSIVSVDEYTLIQPLGWGGASTAIESNTSIDISKYIWGGTAVAMYDNTLTNPEQRLWGGTAVAMYDNAIDLVNPAKLRTWDGSDWVIRPHYSWTDSGWVADE